MKKIVSSVIAGLFLLSLICPPTVLAGDPILTQSSTVSSIPTISPSTSTQTSTSTSTSPQTQTSTQFLSTSPLSTATTQDYPFGFTGIKAVNPEGKRAVAGSDINVVYIVLTQDLTKPVATVSIPVPSNESQFDYKLTEAQFLDSKVAQLTVRNGKKYFLDTESLRLSATPIPMAITDADQMRKLFNLTYTGTDSRNWSGSLNEKWFQGLGGSYYILPDGKVYQWGSLTKDGMLQGKDIQVGKIDPVYYQYMPDWLSVANLTTLLGPSTKTVADIQNLPGKVQLTQIAGDSQNKTSVASTLRGMKVNYETTLGGWAGGGFSFDDFGTTSVETQDLSLVKELTLGLKATASRVKVEVIDNTGQKASVYLVGVSSTQEQVFTIPTAQLTGIDLTKVRLMYFIVEGASLTGTLEVNRLSPAMAILTDPLQLRQTFNLTFTGNDYRNYIGLNEKWCRGTEGWYYILSDGKVIQSSGNIQVGKIDPVYYQYMPDWLSLTSSSTLIGPSNSFTSSNITNLPGFPQITRVAPEGNTSTVTRSARGVLFDYNTSVGGWAGGGFTFDDLGTSSIETQNLSQFSLLTFGLKGNTSRVKLEVIDAQGQKASVYLVGIQSDKEQIWVISTSALQGIDLTKVRLAYFVVEGSNLTGTLEANWVPTT